MSFTIEVASNAAASAWTDISGMVRRESVRMGGVARNGEVGTGFGFDLVDDAAAVTIPAKRVVRLTIDGAVRARGRVFSKGVGRATQRAAGDSRQFDVECSDGNAHLYGIIVHDWERPAETDVERVTALLEDYLQGSPRASTDLADTWISSSGPVNLPAKTYNSTNPNDVLAEVARMAGKLYFVTVYDELFYRDESSTSYAASGFSVSDAVTASSTSFHPIFEGQPGRQDGGELLSGMRLLYGSAGSTQASVTVSDAAVAAAHDHWESPLFSSGATTEAEAEAEAEALLDEVKIEEESYRFAVLLTEAQLDKIKYGQTFSFRAAAAGVTSPRTIRAGRIEYQEAQDGLWFVWIESGWPDKTAPRLEKVAGSLADPKLGDVLDDLKEATCAECGVKPPYQQTWVCEGDWFPLGLFATNNDTTWVGERYIGECDPPPDNPDGSFRNDSMTTVLTGDDTPLGHHSEQGQFCSPAPEGADTFFYRFYSIPTNPGTHWKIRTRILGSGDDADWRIYRGKWGADVPDGDGDFKLEGTHVGGERQLVEWESDAYYDSGPDAWYHQFWIEYAPDQPGVTGGLLFDRAESGALLGIADIQVCTLLEAGPPTVYQHTSEQVTVTGGVAQTNYPYSPGSVKVQGLPVNADETDPTTGALAVDVPDGTVLTLHYQIADVTGTGSANPSPSAGASTIPFPLLPTGTTSTTVAIGDHSHVGSGTPATTVESETTFGITPAVGTDTEYARQDHTHGTPADPVPAHAAAGDPHTGYQKEAEKGAASGYASLDGSTKVPIAELPTGTTSSTVSLGDHTHGGGGPVDPDDVRDAGRWEHAVITGSPPDDLYADGDWLYIWVPGS